MTNLNRPSREKSQVKPFKLNRGNLATFFKFLLPLLLVILTLSQNAETIRDGNKDFNAFDSEFLESLTIENDSEGSGGSGSSSLSGGGQCEPVAQGGFCSKVNNYNLTRMPNFFEDSNQIQALERATNFEKLARTRCSDYIQNYLCELITPICLDGVGMRKFEIYPCRSVCKQIVLDCQMQILQLFSSSLGDSINLPIGFQCDQLPYDKNGEDGPCHELSQMQPNRWLTSPSLHAQAPAPPPPLPTLSPSSTLQKVYNTHYHPSTPNHPNFIVGSSSSPPTSSGTLVVTRGDQPPKSSTNNNEINKNNLLIQRQRDQDQDQSSFLTGGQGVRKIGQHILWFLTEYSNLLSIITVILLLIALNIKRISRVKTRVCGASHSTSVAGRCWSLSSGSSSSTSSGKRVLSPSDRKLGGVNPIHQHLGHHLAAQQLRQHQHHLHQVTLSPSSSSSPIKHHLFAQTSGVGAGGSLSPMNPNVYHNHQHLQHQLFGGAHSQHATYHLARSQANSQVGANPDGENHYDYIEVGAPQTAKPQSSYSSHNNQRRPVNRQIYNNILLSSPSHQVLLMGGSGSSSGASATGSSPSTSSESARQYTDSLQRRGQLPPPPI